MSTRLTDGGQAGAMSIPRAMSGLLGRAQSQIEDIPKASRNDFHGYDFASAEDILRYTRKVLHAAGLVALRGSWEWVRWTVTHDGEPMQFVRVQMQLISPVGMSGHQTTSGNDLDGLKFSEMDEPFITYIDWPVVVSKGRPIDKALASALTDATKYWLLGLLMVPRADCEMDQRDDSTHQPKGRI